MNLAATRFGDTMIARASAGTRTSSDTDMVTLTSAARGSIESILPTGTPTTRTSSPGYRPTVDENSATTLWAAATRPPHEQADRQCHHQQPGQPDQQSAISRHGDFGLMTRRSAMRPLR